MKKFAFLGVGNMAGAIIGGLGNGYEIFLYDKDAAKCDLHSGEGRHRCSAAAEAVTAADYIFLSVKPQNFSELFSELDGISTDGKVFVSIAAGVPIKRIISLLGHDAAVIRTMPNTPLLIGKGVTALTRNLLVDDDDYTFIENVFASVGKTFRIGEDEMNAIISVTSTAPAYVYLMIKAICDGAEAQGFDRDDMLELVCAMTEGSAELLRTSGKTPDEMISIVASKGGTTEAALSVLNERGFEDILKAAMLACTARADSL